MEDNKYDSSDSDDSDYVVDQQECLTDSSIESEADATSEVEDIDESCNKNIKKKKNNTKQKKSSTNRRQKSCLSKTEGKSQLEDTENSNESNICTNTINEKERADSLWQSFLTDTSSSSKAQSQKKSIDSTNTPHCINTQNKEQKTDLTTEKEINSKSLKMCESEIISDECERFNNKKLQPICKESVDKCTTSTGFLKENNLKKRGISSILNNINKKPKLTVLEKSKLDWNQFKDQHNLHEEITNFNRGKNGYLEKQDFLQRTDSRQFEIEKGLRNIGKRKL